MSEQLSIDWGAFARCTDPVTSHRAAATVDTSALEDIVLGYLRERLGGATSYEIASVLRMSLVTVSPRLRPLVKKGLVVDSGRKECGESGRSRIVWVAA